MSRRAFCCITRGIAVSFEAFKPRWTFVIGITRALRAADAVRGTREARRAGVGVSVSITSYCWVADAFDTDVSRRALLIGTGRIADAVVAHKSVWAFGIGITRALRAADTADALHSSWAI